MYIFLKNIIKTILIDKNLVIHRIARKQKFYVQY
jgi:hypothetical protein